MVVMKAELLLERRPARRLQLLVEFLVNTGVNAGFKREMLIVSPLVPRMTQNVVQFCFKIKWGPL